MNCLANKCEGHDIVARLSETMRTIHSRIHMWSSANMYNTRQLTSQIERTKNPLFSCVKKNRHNSGQ